MTGYSEERNEVYLSEELLAGLHLKMTCFSMTPEVICILVFHENTFPSTDNIIKTVIIFLSTVVVTISCSCVHHC